MKFATQIKNNASPRGDITILWVLAYFPKVGSSAIPKIAANIRARPPALCGTERKMAYAYKKYHSGLITAGVFILLIVCHWRGSAVIFGKVNASAAKPANINTKPTKSFEV